MTLTCTSNREAFAQIRAIFAEGVHLKRLLIFKDLQATNPRLHPPDPAHGPVLIDHSLHMEANVITDQATPRPLVRTVIQPIVVYLVEQRPKYTSNPFDSLLIECNPNQPQSFKVYITICKINFEIVYLLANSQVEAFGHDWLPSDILILHAYHRLMRGSSHDIVHLLIKLADISLVDSSYSYSHVDNVRECQSGQSPCCCAVRNAPSENPTPTTPELYTALYARMESYAYETNKMGELFDYEPDVLSDRASFLALIDVLYPSDKIMQLDVEFSSRGTSPPGPDTPPSSSDGGQEEVVSLDAEHDHQAFAQGALMTEMLAGIRGSTPHELMRSGSNACPHLPKIPTAKCQLTLGRALLKDLSSTGLSTVPAFHGPTLPLSTSTTLT
ncbi:hypothetical protein KCU74_g27, partial [Aureobasidium melanogenum]